LSGGETLLGLQRVDPRAPVGLGPPPELGGTGDPITYAGGASLFGTPATTSELRLQISAIPQPVFIWLMDQICASSGLPEAITAP
jgi:hypothetical protein